MFMKLDKTFVFIVLLWVNCQNHGEEETKKEFDISSGASYSEIEAPEIIIDSDYNNVEEAIEGTLAPANLVKNLVLVNIEYYSFDEKLHKGQIVADRELAEEITEIFSEIKESKFPIKKVVPIIKYGWSDSLSMLDNNSSCFNYRKIKGINMLSLHSRGRAIDINPLQNPEIKYGIINPEGAFYSPNAKGTILKESAVYIAFKKRGWEWGGNWSRWKDYQHFQKK